MDVPHTHQSEIRANKPSQLGLWTCSTPTPGSEMSHQSPQLGYGHAHTHPEIQANTAQPTKDTPTPTSIGLLGKGRMRSRIAWKAYIDNTHSEWTRFWQSYCLMQCNWIKSFQKGFATQPHWLQKTPSNVLYLLKILKIPCIYKLFTLKRCLTHDINGRYFCCLGRLSSIFLDDYF